VVRPHAEYFRYAEPGVLVAKPKASEERSPSRRAVTRVKHFLLGRPLANEQDIEERLSKKKALAIFSSDAISSSAYATEEILRALLVGGFAVLALAMPVSIGIAILLAIVAISYRQVVFAYPSGGGSYSVSKQNFGRNMSLVAASALFIDYVLTVAVSTSSAVEQIVSAVEPLAPYRVAIGVVAIGLITLGNLRGIREAGSIFAIPTYLFLGGAFLMIAIGAFRIVVQGDAPGYTAPSPGEAAGGAVEALSLILILRAFASGAVALTGTEAIATGVPAFRPPESRNAAATLLVMAVLLASLFIGVTFLATSFGVAPIEHPEVKTVISQVAARVYGDGTVPFLLFQAFTALLLFLAANTSFNAFPRLAAVVAEDGFLPRQFSFRGDRLAFTLGIVLLGALAMLLVDVFGGSVAALIPLYAVGVFIDFTISQSGMIRHWLSTRAAGWWWRLSINAVGAVLTGVVAVVVTLAKAPTSLIVIVLIPILVGMMLFIRRQYDRQAAELALRPDQVFTGPHRRERVVIPVNGLNRAVVQAVNFGRSLATDVRAVHVTENVEEAVRLRAEWERRLPGVPLVTVESPYRALVNPFAAYLDVVSPAGDRDTITIVVVPEYVGRHWWERILYNQVANRLRTALLGRPHTVVVTVPYRRSA
jgi:amino acid transporter